MRSILLFIFGFLLLFSCTKFGKNVTVKGRVYDPVTGQGIAGAKIYLQKGRFSYEGGAKTVKTAVSDENGYYRLDKLGLASYFIRCETGDRYDLGFTTDNGQTFASNFYLTVKKGKVVHADYYAVGYGNYQIIINNVNCQGAGDTIVIKQTNTVGSFLNIDWVVPGCSGYTTALQKTPSGEVFTEYTVKRNGLSNTYDTTFFIQPNQDNIQTINY